MTTKTLNSLLARRRTVQVPIKISIKFFNRKSEHKFRVGFGVLLNNINAVLQGFQVQCFPPKSRYLNNRVCATISSRAKLLLDHAFTACFEWL
jgi:hypothetical protein